MRALNKLCMFFIALGAAALAPPAAAQYSWRYGYSYGPQNGQRGGAPGLAYAFRSYGQVLVNQCASATQARLDSNRASGARVLGISEASRSVDGGMLVRGVATSGRVPYGAPGFVDLGWRCWADYRGVVRNVTISGAIPAYGDNYYDNRWGNDYSQYGYRRY